MCSSTGITGHTALPRNTAWSGRVSQVWLITDYGYCSFTLPQSVQCPTAFNQTLFMMSLIASTSGNCKSKGGKKCCVVSAEKSSISPRHSGLGHYMPPQRSEKQGSWKWQLRSVSGLTTVPLYTQIVVISGYAIPKQILQNKTKNTSTTTTTTITTKSPN